MLRHLPNLLTSLNLLCGCLAIVFVFKGEMVVFASLTCASLLFDFADGFAARALGTASAMGRELDSLADMIAFGVVPGTIMYHLFLSSSPVVLHLDQPWVQWIGLFPFVITVFSGLRLAKFNIDPRQTDTFLGVPTPAITVFVTGLALTLRYDRFHLTPMILNSFFIGGVTLILCYLLVSELPMMKLKFGRPGSKENLFPYLLIVAGLVLFVTLGAAGIPLAFILYVILSLIRNRMDRNLKTKHHAPNEI